MKPQVSSLQSNPNSAPLVLIPAAGFGTRVGSPAAKELILGADGSPLIAFGLEQARLRHWPVHVITRKEKTELIRYLKAYQSQTGIQLEIQIIDPSREWPDTLLKSQSYWREKNLLCLPDTVFQPASIWDQLAASTADIAAAVFHPPSLSTWGAFEIGNEVNPSSVVRPPVLVCEKPQDHNVENKNRMAWGLLAWTKSAGLDLLQAQLDSGQDHQWRSLNHSFEGFQLEFFEDVTRGLKL